MPKVSVILPTYNRAHVLPYAIRSVLSQSFSDLELIIVDDNSTDDTRTVVSSFTDSRVVYIKNDPNLKLPRALNRGFSVAKGKYLTWTSDDNIFGESAIERMVEVLNNNNCDFVFADYYDFSELNIEGQPKNCRHIKLPAIINMKKGNAIGACFMYSHAVYEKIGTYDPELFLNEDYDFFMRVSCGFKMYHIPEPLYYFKRNEESLYCAHFCEVRAGSLLVRYKNKFLNKEELLEGMVDLLVSNIDCNHNVFLRSVYLTIKRFSFKLTKIFEKLVRKYFWFSLKRQVIYFLNAYDIGNKSFQETKLSLSDLLNAIAVIEYRN